jgi:HK97 family phage portal protein
MGFWSRWFGREAKMTSLELFREVYGGGRESKAGITVNTDVALQTSTVLACVRVIAEGCSQTPFHLMQQTGDGRKIVADDPLDYVLYRRPNPWQTSFEFRETLLFHAILTGNAYCFINRVGMAGEIRELIPIEPGRVTVKQRPDLSLEYKITSDTGEAQIFPQEAIWHLRGPSWNTWMGLDATKLARNAIGLAISLEQGQSEFQKNGATMTGMVSTEGKLDKAKFEQLAAWLDRHQVGGDRSHKPLIVDMNAKFLPTAMTGVDQQLIETRNHQIVQMCAHFRVLPIMVGHYDKAATYASAEQMFLHHVIHTLMPWYQRIEQSADRNLLTDAQRGAGMYTKINANGLMRGAAKDQAEYFAKALGSGGGRGWMSQNDVRDALDMDRSDDPEADKLPQPAQPAPSAAKPPASEE